jgi:hypothetical protein
MAHASPGVYCIIMQPACWGNLSGSTALLGLMKGEMFSGDSCGSAQGCASVVVMGLVLHHVVLCAVDDSVAYGDWVLLCTHCTFLHCDLPSHRSVKA